MANSYNNIVDVAEVEKLVGGQYTNDAKLVKSGVAVFEGPAMHGTQVDWIKERLFQSAGDGQAVGIGTELTYRARSQSKYHMPIVQRGESAVLDMVEEDISDAVAKGLTQRISEDISAQSAQMVDGVLTNIMIGVGKYQETNSQNFLDTSTGSLALADITNLKKKRGDAGLFQNSVIVAPSSVVWQFWALGGVAFTSNTAGIDYQNEYVRAGFTQNILGLGWVMSDKLGTTNDTDLYWYIAEKGAITARGAEAPKVFPFAKIPRRLAEELSFYVRVGGTISGMGWVGTASDTVENATLATGTNWTLAADNAKYVPFCTGRCAAIT